jgi:Calcineurin-like phosphoesterase
VVLVLAVSDEVDNALYADVGAVREARLIVACGDLPFDYLGYLMNALDVPLVFVPGNHDPDVSGYRTSRAGLTLRAGLPARPPWPAGAVNADRAVVDVADLRVAGLGGSHRYRDGPNQYTPREQARRARSLARRARWRKLRDGRGVDVLLTHAPPRGAGDREDPAHQGFEALNWLTGRLQPPLLLHGHIHPDDEPIRDHRLGHTIVRNVVGRHLLDIEPGGGARRSPTGARHAG